MTELHTPEGRIVRATDNMDDFYNHIRETFDQLRAGIIDPTTAKVIAKLADTYISAMRTEIIYNKLRGEIPSVKFLDIGKTK